MAGRRRAGHLQFDDAARRRGEALQVQLVHVFSEALEDLVDVGVRPVRRQVGADLFDDRRRRLLIVRRRVGPLAAGMQRVPRGALVDPGFRAVAMLAQAEAYFRLRIPDRLEEIDQVVLGRFLETRLHDEEAALEVVDVERGDGFADAARVLVEPGRQLGALADRILGGLVVRIGLADVDRVVHALERRVGAEVAAVVDGVDAGAVELRDLR